MALYRIGSNIIRVGGGGSLFSNGAGGGGSPGFTPESGFTLTDNEDGTYTINDASSRFGSKTNALPLVYADFETNLNGHSTYSRTGTLAYFNGGAGNTRVTSGVTPPSGSTGMLRTDMTDYQNHAGPDVTFDSSSTMYCFVKKYYNWDVCGGVDTNLKSVRLWDTGITKSFWINENGETGPGDAHIQTDDWSADYETFDDIPYNQWVTVEYDYQRGSSSGATDGYVHYIRNALHMYPASKRFLTFDGDMPQWGVLWFDQISNNVEPAGSYIYNDVIYVDDTPARVLISEEPSYQDVTSGTEYAREIQIPTAWSSSEITFVYRGAFSSLSGLSLYVVDASRNKLLIGTFD